MPMAPVSTFGCRQFSLGFKPQVSGLRLKFLLFSSIESFPFPILGAYRTFSFDSLNNLLVLAEMGGNSMVERRSH